MSFSSFLRWPMVVRCTLHLGCLFIAGLNATVDADDFRATLDNFAQQYNNRYFEFEYQSTYQLGPTWPTGTLLCASKGVFKNWNLEQWHFESTRENAQFLKSNDVPPERITNIDVSKLDATVKSVEGKIRGEDFYYQRNFGSTLINGLVKKAGKGSSPFYGGFADFLFGYEYYLGHPKITFFELLDRSNFTTEQVQLEGINASLVTCPTVYGSFRLWFDASTARLLQVESLRGPTDILYTGGKRDGSGYAVNTSVHSHFRHFNEVPLISIRMKYHNLVYREIDGQTYCVGFDWEYADEFANGSKDLVTAHLSIANVRRVTENKPKKGEMKFATIHIPDDTRFHATDDPNIPYVVHRGVIHRVVNESTLESLDGVRFPWVRSRLNYWVVLGVAIGLGCLTLFIIWRRRVRLL